MGSQTKQTKLTIFIAHNLLLQNISAVLEYVLSHGKMKLNQDSEPKFVETFKNHLANF
jgi:hypothetical protein